MYTDRIQAGQVLSEGLLKYENDKNALVLAIPRGGVMTGYVVANHLGIPLEIALVKKIGHPDNPEFAIGAVSLDSEVINENAGLSDGELKEEIEAIRARLMEQHKLYLGEREPKSLKDKTVIIVDDGIATGNTISKAVKVARRSAPRKIVVAAPVGAAETIAKLELIADEVVCSEMPSPFIAIGDYYKNFYEVSDTNVIRLLKNLSENNKTISETDH